MLSVVCTLDFSKERINNSFSPCSEIEMVVRIALRKKELLPLEILELKCMILKHREWIRSATITRVRHSTTMVKEMGVRAEGERANPQKIVILVILIH
jgi:hypothetical protein